jgi:hypothetical protein
MRRLISVLALLLAGCEPSELRFAPIAPIGGGSSAPAPARPAATPLAPGAHKMLQDPDQAWDESLDIYADSDTTAQAKCQKRAQLRSNTKTIVQCLGCVQMTLGTRGDARYSCTLRVEAR